MTPTPVNSAVSVGWIHDTATKRHRGEVVDLVGLGGAQRVDQRALVEQVALVQRDAVAQVLDALELLGRGAADHAVDLVALLEQQLGQVGAVLPGDPGDQRALRAHSAVTSLACSRSHSTVCAMPSRTPIRAFQPSSALGLLDRRPAALDVDLEARQVLELEARRGRCPHASQTDPRRSRPPSAPRWPRC